MLQLLANEISLYNDTRNVNKLPPYHTKEHMETAYRIAKELWEIEKQDPKYTYTAPEEVMEVTLMLGVLFHDVNHCGGRVDDHSNIQLAVKELKQFCLIHSEVFNRVFAKKYPDWVSEVLRRAVSIIECTEFPFVNMPCTLLERLMRDADVLYPAYVGDPKIIMEDLRSEITVRRDCLIGYDEMIRGQEEFIKGATLYTNAGQAMWDKLTPPYMTKLNEYVSAL